MSNPEAASLRDAERALPNKWVARLGQTGLQDKFMGERLSGLQLDVMRVLWQQDEATVADVQAALAPQRKLAYSTVATLLGRLERKGRVSHRADGRTYIYRAAVSEDRVSNTIVGDVLERLFDGSPSELVNHLLESRHVDADELQQIKQLIEQHETERRKSRKRGRRD